MRPTMLPTLAVSSTCIVNSRGGAVIGRCATRGGCAIPQGPGGVAQRIDEFDGRQVRGLGFRRLAPEAEDGRARFAAEQAADEHAARARADGVVSAETQSQR